MNLYTARIELNDELITVTREANDIRQLERILRAEFGKGIKFKSLSQV